MSWSVRRGKASEARERGAAAVEFALVIIPLMVLVWGIICYGVMFSYRQALSQAAGEGARAAVAAPTASISSAATAAISNALSSYHQTCGTTLVCSVSSPTSGTLPNGATCPSGHTCVQVTVTFPYRSNPLIPNVPGLGIVVPENLTFTQTVEVS